MHGVDTWVASDKELEVNGTKPTHKGSGVVNILSATETHELCRKDVNANTRHTRQRIIQRRNGPNHRTKTCGGDSPTLLEDGKPIA